MKRFFILLTILFITLPGLVQADLHEVKKGDTLWSIAQKYDLTVDEIKKLNEKEDDLISIGDKIYISKEGKKHRVKKGDTLWSIAKKYGLTVDDLLKINNKEDTLIVIDEELLVEVMKNEGEGTTDQGGGYEYVVKPGDTLWSIAQKLGTTVENLKTANNLNSNSLSIGEKLLIKEKRKTMYATHALNIRESASQQSNIVGLIPEGGEVTTGKLNGDWYSVTYEGKAGYSHKNFLSSEKISNSEEPSVEYVKVNALALNMRSGPSTQANIKGLLRKGDRLKVLEKSYSDWWLVTNGTIEGYVNTNYIEVVEPQKPSDTLILIDPGHGGYDPGAVNGEVTEKEINLAISEKVEKKLKSRGYNVQKTRNNNTETCSSIKSEREELNCRSDMAKKIGADAFVSIHANSGPELARGTETYFSRNGKRSAESEILAKKIHENYQIRFGSLDRGVKVSNFKVLTGPEAPSVMLEVGFMSNENDLQKLLDENTQEEVAEGVLRGIESFFIQN